ncbi:Fe-S protein assembly co-chaperone HscB [Polynucleobacter cosmopolitanus]|uniref:Co-chaperone protein HscB homolog n=1 Tax=Polynucleobacter cosmopolitanus TaxID=351345 RepID=A0A229FRN6_9BURK|nr:Fe-S protein assembly co-chaperone HscB [Polynucleobacter cosmopolitanus]OXL14492.1 Fe-S protein assembly co-chaperone HscB [Polynucleobacter cosmopolitanus]
MSVVVANLSGFDDYFALFQLKPQFKIDRQALESAYLTVQQKVHPDMHAQASDSDKRVSMQLSALANSAYRTLMNPIQRGLYMCARNGVDPQLETNTAMPAQFLMQQMKWRETLDDVRDQPSELDQLYKEVEQTRANLLKEVELAIDEANDFELAAKQLRALLFIDKFSVELEDAISA